ncbi:MAG: response regulator transcription factor [Cyanobacteria bacterium CRU_2_1]|nr:response regulator transcription factor [Cyanobacteria bacterium RU_5_0]NJR58805.1 response regulator transcription factor [Cyanobacteria bacterium CRU_2_1]
MCRILIAEDEPRIAAFIEKGLRKNGFTTVIAKTGSEALEMAQAGDYDLMLLDLGLPGIDGWTVLDELRHNGNTLHIIIVTARDGMRDRIESFKRGADDYITKPFQFSVLLNRVREQLSDR